MDLNCGSKNDFNMVCLYSQRVNVKNSYYYNFAELFCTICRKFWTG